MERSFAISAALLVNLVIGVVLVVVHTRVDAILVRGLESRAYSIAKSIGAVATPSLLAYNYAALQVAAEGAVEDPDLVYVVLHDKEGQIAGLASSAGDSAELPALPLGVELPHSRPLVLEDASGETRVLEAIVPVRVEGVARIWGTVRVGMDRAPVAAALRRMDFSLVVIGLILALPGMLASRYMARRITAPLRRLAEGTEALSRGDTTYRLEITRAREIAELEHAFNRMMDRVQEKAAESTAYHDQLGQLNSTLEQQVQQRTRALEESETLYRTLVEHSPDSILIIQDGQVRFINRAFTSTFGFTEEEALDSSFRLGDLFDDDCVSRVAESILAWQSGEATQPEEVLARDSAGGSRVLELRGGHIDHLGRPAAVCLLIDMSESKRLREKLEDTERLRALGELSSGVAHDFNNLLGAVLGRVQLLRRREFEAPIDRDLAVIEKAARDGRETVRRIQEFARTRRDQPFSPIDMHEILADAVEITRSRWKTEAERRNVGIRIELDCKPVPPILGNATELREVFTNLVLNAVDAMPQGGTIHLRCHAGDGVVYAEVEDTGVGMTDEIRRHLFDPFFTTKGMAGNGLGMSVAYGIVTRHEGTIDVTTAMGLGTKFTMGFPTQDGAVVVAGTDGAAMPQLVRPGRILVIDDEPPIAQLLEDALSAEGHTVEVAVSGRDGVRMAEMAEFDLVLSDLGMPDMSGWEVASRIRQRRPGTPVVLVTGWGTTLSNEEVERSGVSAVVHKPFEIKDLLDTTHRVLLESLPPGEEPSS